MARLRVVKSHIAVDLCGQNLGQFFYCLETRQSKTYTYLKYIGWSLHHPLGATSIHPFICERRRNLGPHSI